MASTKNTPTRKTTPQDSKQVDGSPVGEKKPDIPTIQQPDGEGKQDSNSSTTNAPLAPPPKPNQNGDGDYFNGQHNGTQLSKEPNPFENAFGAPSEPTTKPQLPGVSSLTSPASLLPPGGNTPGWASLRSGPLSPAMLQGPTNNNDYFSSDHHFTGSFPTPNESSLRTGLTPGGGGSMFPHPSPNSQAIYNSLASGGATPGTLDFQRTAMTARAHSASNYNMAQNGNGATSQPQNPNIQPDLDSKPYHGATSNPQQDQSDPFGSHQTNDAANGLFMLAQQAGNQRGAAQQQSQYPVQQHQGYQQVQDHRGNKNSVGSAMSGSTEGQEQYSDAETKTSAKGRGKKGSAGKGAQNGKRKTDDTPSKQAHKRQRGSIGQSISQDDDEMDEDEDQSMNMEDGIDANGRKMTDEEKRKNFLERNRVAALKCRQRKKQWLANLQQKVEIFSTENDALAATVTQLREEIVGLKTLLLAHKDCPVSQAQGISGMAMHQIAGDAANYANPYGMGNHMQQGQMQQGMQQRR